MPTRPFVSTCTALVGEPSGAPSAETAPGASMFPVMLPGAMTDAGKFVKPAPLPLITPAMNV